MYVFEPANMGMEVYNMQGSLVQRKELGKLERGLHYIDLEGEGLPSGSYLVKIMLGDKMFSRKVVKY
ncbi:MAG: T9SS type A sorting domain-containing protein, partial [Flavobacteriales bacterium]|nr:T9SS type A sorting domain-containing protein [Flavobacteriales bacterium]